MRVDLRCVNFEVSDLKPFFHLAFPAIPDTKTCAKPLGIDGTLMATLIWASVMTNDGRNGQDQEMLKLATERIQ